MQESFDWRSFDTSDPLYLAKGDAPIAKRNFTHSFLKGAVEPAIVDHILDGDWWILQVLK